MKNLPVLSLSKTFIQIYYNFEQRDKRRIKILLILQFFSNILDVIGIFLVGIIGALSVNGIQSKAASGITLQAIDFFRISELSFQYIVAIFSIMTLVVFIFRIILSLYFTKINLKFLSLRFGLISGDLIRKILTSSRENLNEKSTQEIIYTSTFATESMILRVFSPYLVTIVDAMLLIIILFSILIYSFYLALIIIVIFGLISYLTYSRLNNYSFSLGKESTRLAIESNNEIADALDLYRELHVRGRTNWSAEKIRENRLELSKISAKSNFIPSISRYIIEATVIFGTFFVAAIQFILKDANTAIAGIAIYLAASSRIAPTALRVQQNLLQAKNNLPAATSALSLIKELGTTPIGDNRAYNSNFNHSNFIGDIEIKNMSFSYKNANKPALKNINISIKDKNTVAVIGPTGAGKSTLINLILGLQDPSSGEINIFGTKPKVTLELWPGSIGYVAQTINLINGSIKDNLTVGFAKDEISNEIIDNCIKDAKLTQFVSSLPFGIDTNIGDKGANLSGGQKQKLGIARALLTKPKILILDEATSALDAVSEQEVMETINNLNGKITMIIIAHRLSTLEKANTVVYIDNGAILHTGSFKEIINMIPEINKRAKLLIPELNEKPINEN